MPTPTKAMQRTFGKKYKADGYAQYYSEKHDSTWGRRISNYFEKRMVRRALRRVAGHGSVSTMLDCPSGTGRFLPLLATLDVSVIAMDTSAAMLGEGRKHHSLFKTPPVASVGSAAQIPLVDNAVDVILCSRLLHHIPEGKDRVTMLREFARVARLGVVVTFFDSASWRAHKRSKKAQRTGKSSGRHSMSRAAFTAEAVEAGLKPLGMTAMLRYHTEVTAAAFLC